MAEVKIKMKISGAQVAAARELLKITQTELGNATGLSYMTISNFEAGKMDPHPATVDKLRNELEQRGIEFCNGTGIGVRLDFLKAAEYAKVGKRPKPAV